MRQIYVNLHTHTQSLHGRRTFVVWFARVHYGLQYLISLSLSRSLTFELVNKFNLHAISRLNGACEGKKERRVQPTRETYMQHIYERKPNFSGNYSVKVKRTNVNMNFGTIACGHIPLGRCLFGKCVYKTFDGLSS